MSKFIVCYLKALLLFILDLIHRAEKYVRYLITGRHEFERICEGPYDIYEKTFKVEQWLMRTTCVPIRKFLINQSLTGSDNPYYHKATNVIDRILARYLDCNTDNSTLKNENLGPRKRRKKSSKKIFHEEIRNLEDGDRILSDAVHIITTDMIIEIKKKKHLDKGMKCLRILTDVIRRIVAYRLTLMTAERLAGIVYGRDMGSHTDMLISLWNNLVKADTECMSGDATAIQENAIPQQSRRMIDSKQDIVSSRWSSIGFQGEDPGTDFRGMGLLGLQQLEYLSRKPKRLSIDLLKRSLDEHHEYPWAIVGINITYNLLCLFKDGSMKHLYYDDWERSFQGERAGLNIISLMNNLYIEFFLRFDCLWRESKPENIFAFKDLIVKFRDIVKADLCNRSFTFKFLY